MKLIERLMKIRMQIIFMLYNTKCFFIGHDIWYNYDPWSYEDDGCLRCGLDIDDFFVTIPDVLNRVYCYLVERDWKWFSNLDNWLIEKHNSRLPYWWEY